MSAFFTRRCIYRSEEGAWNIQAFLFSSGPVHTSWSPLVGAAAMMMCRRAGAWVCSGGDMETETLAFSGEITGATDGGRGSGPPGGGSGVQGSPEGVRYAALGGCGFDCGRGWCW